MGISNVEQKLPVKNTTIFELASVTKVFVSTLLAIEVDKGKLKLSNQLVNYIPQLKNTKNAPIDRVELVNLATHSASLPDKVHNFGVKDGDIQVLYNKLKTWRPEYPIGSKYYYSKQTKTYI